MGTCQTPLCNFWQPRTDGQGCASECPDVKNYKSRSDTGCFIAVPMWQQWVSKDSQSQILLFQPLCTYIFLQLCNAHCCLPMCRCCWTTGQRSMQRLRPWRPPLWWRHRFMGTHRLCAPCWITEPVPRLWTLKEAPPWDMRLEVILWTAYSGLLRTHIFSEKYKRLSYRRGTVHQLRLTLENG